MINLDIYSTTGHYFNVLDKLPSYIKPLGLGNNNYPDHWLKEKNGKNISNLNKYYREVSGIYWIWKNRLNDKDTNDWIGNCGYRKLWLNSLYDKKQKLSFDSLYSNLLNPDNKIFENCVANATLKAISEGMTLSKTPVYADIDGYIGTSGKKYSQNIFKKIKLYFFRKIKTYFFKHKKY